MEFWDEIINTAILGAGKKMPDKNLLPEGIGLLVTHIEQQPIDREEQFLQITSLAFNFRQSGVAAFEKIDASIVAAPAEEKPYCSGISMQLLGDVIDTESVSLLQLWLSKCNNAAQIISPAVIPTVLTLAAEHKKLQPAVVTAVGRRGQWLCQFNKQWNFTIADNPEEIWQTGTSEQRKQVLKDIRRTDGDKALQWLKQTWAQEDANTKTAFLEILHDNINGNDENFLSSLSGEKSKKVKDEAITLLKRIPTSTIIQSYKNVLQQSISIKKEKRLLGLGNKTFLDVHLPADINEEIYKTGIDKLSPQKNIPDNIYVLYQLISFTPPDFWEFQFGSTPADIIDVFQKSEHGKQLLPAIGIATGRFRSTVWAEQIMKDEAILYPELIALLPGATRDAFLLKYFEKDPVMVINHSIQTGREWNITLAKSILGFAAKNPYQYNKSFFNQYIHLIPVTLANEMERFFPQEEYLRNVWAGTSAYIVKLLHLKASIIQSFNV